ncbi:TlpA disulfide reductase family protein [Actinoplanes flavus]|uniref:TlpA family protein disulfide reductase n=1 Tax=Actinoplanes flavus TaxID=2820290 RepID=A0ABS3V0M3_9ACTN|nr:TlpA disulfide reductase family protein [Actinoplanes flavus]MBO3744376.1 TlpA family protein disulfide reductase [Actinoplanes flavus]
MSLLAAALAVVAAVTALNLLLTVGLVKRLREHTVLLSDLGGTAPVIAVGAEVGDFTATAVSGISISRADLTDETLVGIFSVTCRPCRATVGDFAAYARTMPGGRGRVLAVVVGDPADAASFVSALSPVAHVVVEDSGGPVGAAFQAQAFPTMLRVAPDAAGRVVVAANRVQVGRPAALAA